MEPVGQELILPRGLKESDDKIAFLESPRNEAILIDKMPRPNNSKKLGRRPWDEIMITITCPVAECGKVFQLRRPEYNARIAKLISRRPAHRQGDTLDLCCSSSCAALLRVAKKLYQKKPKKEVVKSGKETREDIAKRLYPGNPTPCQGIG
jgi:hypothetical protein